MSQTTQIKTVAVIGTGVIGASYTALFLAKGLKVIASPSKENGAEKLKAAVAKAWPVLESMGLAEGASQSNLEFVDDVMNHLDRVDLVQEVSNPTCLSCRIRGRNSPKQRRTAPSLSSIRSNSFSNSTPAHRPTYP